MPSSWPAFDDPLLQQIAAAFLRRRKAIAYQAGLSCTREISECAGEGAIERLNLDLPRRGLRLSVWADGVMWLALSIPGRGRNSGWAFQDSFHGNVLDVSGETLVAMVERTLTLSFGTEPHEECLRLREIWTRVHPVAE